MSVSVAMITLNEAENIAPCLETVTWADEIVIIDAGSTDSTLDIARRYTPHLHSLPFQNFSAQKNEALRLAKGDWVLLLDADERVSPELAQKIREATRAGAEPAVYAVKRTTYFFGKKLRFSGTRHDYPIRLFPKGKARFEKPVHEEIRTDLPVRRIEEPLVHYSTRDLRHYRRKLSCYIPLEREWLRGQGRYPDRFRSLAQPVMKFFYLYFAELGILDGPAGLQYAALSSYYDFLKYSPEPAS